VTIREWPNGSTQLERIPWAAPAIATLFDSPAIPALAEP
jgi:hypothetical protein